MRPINSGRHGSSKQQAWSAATAERSPSRISAIDAAAIAGGSPTRGISSGRPSLGPRPGLAQVKRSHGRRNAPLGLGLRLGTGGGAADEHARIGRWGAACRACLDPRCQRRKRDLLPGSTTTSGLPFPAATNQATPRPTAPAAGRARAANGRRAGHRDAPARHREQREPARRAHRQERLQREPRAWKARSKAASERGRDRARLPGRSECR